MLQVSDIWDDAVKIFGACKASFLYGKIGEGVELLANKGEFDPLIGTLDLCITSQVVAMPPEVETIIGCNICGQPSVARDQLFSFHYNGPGTCGPRLQWEWSDLGDTPLYRELECPSKIIAIAAEDDDIGTATVRIYGFDDLQNKLVTVAGDGTVTDGIEVPVLGGFQAISATAPFVSRITRVRKSLSKGPIRLCTLDNSATTGALLAIYQWDETDPSFRRIKLSHSANAIRIIFRRRVFKVRTQTDVLPVNNKSAMVMILVALKKYADENFELGEAAESTALRWMKEEQFTSNPPVVHPIQVVDGTPLTEACEQME
jgi:hypothetical protein